MANVDPGELQSRIQFLITQRSISPNGFPVETETSYWTRAKIKYVTTGSGDAMRGDAEMDIRKLQIIIPWRGFTPNTGMAIIYGGIRFEVDAVDPLPFGGMFRRCWATCKRREAGQ